MENLKVLDERNEGKYEDIAATLMEITGIQDNEVMENLIDGLSHLENIAQNEYNNDYFRVLYNVLIKVSEMDFE